VERFCTFCTGGVGVPRLVVVWKGRDGTCMPLAHVLGNGLTQFVLGWNVPCGTYAHLISDTWDITPKPGGIERNKLDVRRTPSNSWSILTLKQTTE